MEADIRTTLGLASFISFTGQTSFTRHQRIIDAIRHLLQDIRIVNGYKTDAGNNVVEWTTVPMDPSMEMIRIEYRDEATEYSYDAVGEHLHKLTVILRVTVAMPEGSGEEASPILRDILTDIYAALNKDITLGGLCSDVNQQGDCRLYYGEQAGPAISAEMKYIIEYVTAPGSGE